MSGARHADFGHRLLGADRAGNDSCHYVTDKGRFPDAMLDDMDLSNASSQRRAGFLPYAALMLGVVVVFVSHWITTRLRTLL